MTFEDLVKIFKRAGREGMAYFEYDHAKGVRAVVEALRNEMLDEGIWTEDKIDLWFNDILGGAGEKAGESANTVDAQQCQTTTTFPADPSPVVCEWVEDGRNLWVVNCKSLVSFRTFSKPPTICPSCGKPIVFKEK